MNDLINKTIGSLFLYSYLKNILNEWCYEISKTIPFPIAHLEHLFVYQEHDIRRDEVINQRKTINNVVLIW